MIRGLLPFNTGIKVGGTMSNKQKPGRTSKTSQKAGSASEMGLTEEIDQDLESLKEAQIPGTILYKILTSLGSIHQKLDEDLLHPEKGIRKKAEELSEDIHGEGGVLERVERSEDTTSHHLEKISELERNQKVMIGYISKLEKKVETQEGKITHLQAQLMRDSLRITNLEEKDDENTKETVSTFFKEKLGLDIVPLDAFRRGGRQRDQGRPRQIVCSFASKEDRQAVREAASKLKGIKNPNGDFYFINDQLPEAMEEGKRDLAARAYNVKERAKAEGVEIKVQIRNSQLVVNNHVVNKKVHPPKLQDLLCIDQQEQTKIDEMKMMVTSDPLTEKGSRFQAHLFEARTLQDVRRAYKKMKQEFAELDHISAAYMLDADEGTQDDGEFGAGNVLLRAVKAAGVSRVVIFATRRFGGTHIGPKRFQLIRQVATTALNHYKEQLAG